MIHFVQTIVLMAALRGHPSTPSAELATTLHAALHGFNTQNCAQIYDTTAPWMRGSASRADTIAACQQAFIDGDQHGVTLLHLNARRAGPLPVRARLPAAAPATTRPVWTRDHDA